MHKHKCDTKAIAQNPQNRKRIATGIEFDVVYSQRLQFVDCSILLDAASLLNETTDYLVFIVRFVFFPFRFVPCLFFKMFLSLLNSIAVVSRGI